MTMAWLAWIGMNVLTFSLMGIDKRRAREGRWRIRESTLLLCAALGGAVGGTAGMMTFRHKTRHWYFRLGFPLMAALQLALMPVVFGWL